MDAADLYFQICTAEGWYLEDGQVKSGSYVFDRGVGIRAVSGEKTGYAYSDNLEKAALEQAAQAARSIALSGHAAHQAVAVAGAPTPRYQPLDPIKTLESADKIALLMALDREARAADPRVIQVNASLSGSHEVIMIVGYDGQQVADIRPMVSVHISVVVEDKSGRRESGRAGGGGRVGYDYFLSEDRAAAFAREAVRQAVVNLEATPAPAGMMPVVLGAGWPGVLLHEAVGHGLKF